MQFLGPYEKGSCTIPLAVLPLRVLRVEPPLRDELGRPGSVVRVREGHVRVEADEHLRAVFQIATAHKRARARSPSIENRHKKKRGGGKRSRNTHAFGDHVAADPRPTPRDDPRHPRSPPGYTSGRYILSPSISTLRSYGSRASASTLVSSLRANRVWISFVPIAVAARVFTAEEVERSLGISDLRGRAHYVFPFLRCPGRREAETECAAGRRTTLWERRGRCRGKALWILRALGGGA
ncbi:uncharacterized protein LY79DRAFT_271111 [Colletotrichum navitas]|uniref:Uncharacterized protein n=1 Tax=Colletotrichum navitas TaxID=681940 RepID=A0AAD8PV98_9PEZI|nr:uncharacterized protein LY79DRAFT_271111 [Colletotrichum navitas]KAK1585347.1 hypothetical protein LY79DRAFT_271111 [Colletotrichum navitas]